jgi:single-strand DNA-binding protein
MASFNKVILVGNLTRDPELRYTTGGAAICGLGMAVNRRFSTASGEQREEVCFVDVDVWGRQGESCQNYLRKGSPVLVEGRLRMDSWQDRETGKTRSRLGVTAERIQFLGTPRGEFGSAPGDGGSEYVPEGDDYAPQAPVQAPRPQPQRAPQQRAPQQRAPQQRQAYGPPGNYPQQPSAPRPPAGNQQMPAFEQPEDEGGTLDDIPF